MCEHILHSSSVQHIGSWCNVNGGSLIRLWNDLGPLPSDHDLEAKAAGPRKSKEICERTWPLEQCNQSPSSQQESQPEIARI